MTLQGRREIRGPAAAAHAQPIRNAVQIRHPPKRRLPCRLQLEGNDPRGGGPHRQTDRVVALGRADIDDQLRLLPTDPFDLGSELALVSAEQLGDEAAAD